MMKLTAEQIKAAKETAVQHVMRNGFNANELMARAAVDSFVEGIFWFASLPTGDAGEPVAPSDPMDTPLPCDVTVGHGTMRKGVALRTLVSRMKVLFKMATGEDADEVANRTPEQRDELLRKFQESVATPLTGAPQPALKRFQEIEADPDSDLKTETPLERLRFFLSIALMHCPQDWLDVEPFFDALEAGADALDALSQAALDVLAERKRQISIEGWTSKHDDEHSAGEMAVAAACYALESAAHATTYNPSWRKRFADAACSLWQWGHEWWKPAAPRRMLIKAGALILAEIERLDRAAIASTEGEKL